MPKTNGWSSTNIKYATAALPKATIGNTAQIKLSKAAQSVATHTILILDVCLPNSLLLIQMSIDNLALNVSPTFRETRCSLIHLAARALYALVMPNLVNPSKDLPL